MRSFDATDSYDVKEAADLGAEPWMLELLTVNPSYACWGPHEDYMSDAKGGWSAPAFLESFAEIWGLDDFNECVHFYFEIGRESGECSCGGTGYNPATRALGDDWYDFADTGRRWCDNITQDEVDALWAKRRLAIDFPSQPTAEQVNAWSRGRGLGHDAINRMICVKARATRLGVYGECVECSGRGYVFTAPEPHVNIVLWMLHPRKGCSRGVEVRITRDDLPTIAKYLTSAAARNAERFSRLSRLGELSAVQQ